MIANIKDMHLNTIDSEDCPHTSHVVARGYDEVTHGFIGMRLDDGDSCHWYLSIQELCLQDCL